MHTNECCNLVQPNPLPDLVHMYAWYCYLVQPGLPPVAPVLNQLKLQPSKGVPTVPLLGPLPALDLGACQGMLQSSLHDLHPIPSAILA